MRTVIVFITGVIGFSFFSEAVYAHPHPPNYTRTQAEHIRHLDGNDGNKPEYFYHKSTQAERVGRSQVSDGAINNPTQPIRQKSENQRNHRNNLYEKKRENRKFRKRIYQDRQVVDNPIPATQRKIDLSSGIINSKPSSTPLRIRHRDLSSGIVGE